MTSGFFGRLARKWWLMLALGVLIGFCAGLPTGGRIAAVNMAGASAWPIDITVSAGNEFKIDLINVNSSIKSYDSNYLTSLGEYTYKSGFVTRKVFKWKAIKATDNSPTIVEINEYPFPGYNFESIYKVTINP